jgi:hypothetical protein
MTKKLLCVALVLAFVLTAGAALAEQPSATISIIDVSQAIGIGPVWGQGVITYGGTTHLFKVKGFERLALGREKMDVNGDVYHLKNLGDLAGTYRKANPAGFTFIENKQDLVVQNEKGVVIDLKGAEHGLQLDLVTSGLKIKDIQL